MSPRRGSKKPDKSAQRNRKEISPASSADSDDTSSGEGPPPLTSESDSEDECADNVTIGAWWLQLNDEEKTKRKTCIKIHLLSPFLFGIVPPGLEDKLIDWSYECGLLPTRDVQQVVNPENRTFEAIQIVENGFTALTPFMTNRSAVAAMLNFRNEMVKIDNCKSVLECAEAKPWFVAKRSSLDLPPNAKKEMAIMALILTIYHFAGHVQLSYYKKTDVLKRYDEDCKLAEEKALELKNQGNTEFASENYRAAISRYSRAIGLSPFNYIMYGNRAQSYQNLRNFRQALIDAKRAVILKPDWDKGQYRFKQAANSLHNSAVQDVSFLTFCVDKEVLSAKSAPKQNGAQAVKKENPETTKGTGLKHEDDSGEGSVPELVSADESDTSSGESDRESSPKPEMPDLVDEDASDSNESGIDEEDFNKIAAATTRRLMDSWDSRRPKKMSKSTLEILRKQKEELVKELVKKEAESEQKQERKAEKKPEKVEKVKKTKEVNNVEKVEQPVSIPERKTQIEGILREGSKALLDNSFQEAYESYGKALGFIDTGPPKSLGYNDKNYVIVLYAYGTSLIGLDVHKELESAKNTFQNIITSFKLDFPLAYYGLGRVHHRQNRFHEAIEILEKGLNIIESKSYANIYWPGTDIVIEETREGNLKVSFENFLTICKYPPKPAAICRFDTCSGVKKSIYSNDTDYKGYVRIICTEACLVEYHIQCWKKLKSKYTDKSTDKDFLDSCCFTVDCFGHVSAIQVHDTDGLKTEIHSEKPKPRKDARSEKVSTTEPTAGSKKKKRSKRKEKDISNEVEPKQNDVEIHEERPVPDEKPAAVPEQEKKEPTNEANEVLEEANVVSTQSVEELSKIPESGMFVLKKDEDEQVALPKQGKGKNKKKKTKNVQSLDEFLGRDNEHLRLRPFQHEDEDYDEIPSEPFSRKPPEGWMSDPFSIPLHLQNEAWEIEGSLATISHNNIYPSNDPWKTDSIREYVYSAFINLLKAEGSLHVMSEPMRKLLNIMPEEARILVQKEGGLRDFLAQSSLFTIEADIVTNFEDKLITDLSKPYTKPEGSQLPIKENGIGKLEDISAPDSFSFNTSVPGKYGPVGSHVDSLPLNNNSKKDHLLPDVSETHCHESVSNSVSNGSENVNSSSKTDTWNGHVSSEEFVPLEKDEDILTNEDILNALPPELYEMRKLSELSTTSGGITDDTTNYAAISELINKIVKGDNPKDVVCFVRKSTDEAAKTTEGNDDAMEVKEGNCDVKDSSVKTNKTFSDPGDIAPGDIAPLVDETISKNGSIDTVNIKTTNIESTASGLSDQDLAVGHNKNNKSEQNELTAVPVSSSVPIAKENAVVEPKLTKEKGIQSKPSTKNKIIMTEAMNMPYKTEYEKLLRSCQGWESKYQELLDKNLQMEKKYGVDVVKLEKKLKDCGQKIEVLGKQCDEIQKLHSHDLKALRQEKHDKSEQIKKLQEKISSMSSVSKSEEKQIQALKTEISALQTQHEKEKQQRITETENNEKLKSHSQQLAKRASTAEVQLLELQRDVNFSFFTRALQEAELTLHNIAQILTVNSTPQLQDISQKWQRYISDCKLQLGRNKIMFEASIPQLKEGKPLSSLTNLRISRPGTYPGPPILHLPPGALLPASKPVPAGPANIRPEGNRGPSPTSAPSSQATPAAAVGRPEGVRLSGTTVLPNQTTSTNLGDRPTASAEPKKPTEQPQKGSNSFEKIMMRLSTLFPNYSRTQMTNFIKEVRASKNGSLTGLSFDDIVACVTKLVKAKQRQLQAAQVPAPPNDAVQGGFSGPTASGALPKSSVPILRPVPKSGAAKVVATGATAQLPTVQLPTVQLPSQASGGNVAYEDDPCVICHDEMTRTTRNVSLDCGHTFHHDCITRWLTGEQSTCPTCRVHALLPEDFPQLK